jgi:hypothetical protein
VVLVDPGPQLSGKAFERTHSDHHPGSTIWPLLAEQLAKLGFGVVEAQGAPDRLRDGGLLVSHGWSSCGRLAVAAGARPIALLSFESPVVDVAFYFALRRVGSLFTDVFLFPGALRRVSSAVRRHAMFVPYPRVRPASTPPWNERRLLAVVNANKTFEPVSLLRLASALVRRYTSSAPLAARQSVRRQLICLLEPELRRELYTERIRAIMHFAASDDFDLYGHGWDQPNALIPPPALRTLSPRFRGEPSDKIATLTGYRFALCFENAVFPGYITEKIWDCFAAGTIPVYLGAPDVDRHIPRAAYVDAHEYPAYGALERHLRSMTTTEANRHLSAAQDFMASAAFEPFEDRVAAQRVARAVARAVDERPE